MLVKKTKSGKISCVMSYALRDELFTELMDFLENYNVEVSLKIKNKDDMLRHLYYEVLYSFLFRTDFKLAHNYDFKIILSRAEALAVMFLIALSTRMEILDFKSSIHKIL